MFAYCGNNPVMFIDPTGESFKEWIDEFFKIIEQNSGYYAAAAGVTQADSPFIGIADIVGGLMIIGGLLVMGGQATQAIVFPSSQSIAVPRVEANVQTIPKSQSSKTIIFRYGGTNPGNLTPKDKDLKDGSGLSFSTIPRAGSAITTIEAINATGILRAVQDGPTHVSVYPVGGSMTDWVYAGSNSIWTKTLKSIVIKWDGGSNG